MDYVGQTKLIAGSVCAKTISDSLFQKDTNLLVIGMGICIHLLCTGWYCLPPLSAALNGLHVLPCPVPMITPKFQASPVRGGLTSDACQNCFPLEPRM